MCQATAFIGLHSGAGSNQEAKQHTGNSTQEQGGKIGAGIVRVKASGRATIKPGAPGVKRYRLKQRFLATRALGCMALAAAVPTLGVALTLLAAAVPLALVTWVFQGSATSVGAAAAMGIGIWFAAAFAVGVYSLRAAGHILRHRIPAGYVALGDDGICVRRLWRMRFLSWSEVDSIALDDANRAAAVFARSGERIELPVDHPEVLSESLRQGVRRFRARAPTPKLRVLTAPAEVDAAWLKRARGALEAQGYRKEGLREEELALIAEDPTQSADQRVGAALALSAATEDAKRRVRVAVQDSVEPGLSEAVEDALEDDLSARALRRLLAQPG